LQAVLLALVFHDIVYNPESRTNEADSAVLFERFATEAGLPRDGDDSITGTQRLMQL
jgi:predicted metal-dependent HD superfamily phosphohydrolase